jgi:hypothetical protein
MARTLGNELLYEYLIFPGTEDELFTDLFDGLADREYPLILQNINRLKKVPEIVEQRANAFNLANGNPIATGTRAIKFSKIKSNDNLQLNLVKYWQDFYANDAIAYNHNGVIEVVTVDNGGRRLAAAAQNFTGFIDYASNPSDVIRRDALTYYIDNTGEPYSKYQMPQILCKTNGANVILGPCLSRGHFNLTGARPVVVSGNDGLLPLQDSYDFANLEQILLSFQPVKRTVSGGVFRGSTTQQDYSALQYMYSFPNFLLGEVLYKEARFQAKEVPGRVQLGRPLLEHPELWVKIQADNSYFFPYDKTKYYLPPGYEMYERADGVIIYRNSQNQIEFTFPLGSYMIVQIDSTTGNITAPIIQTPRYVAINAAVKAKMEVMAGVALNGPVPYANFDNYQSSLQLVAYMENLRALLTSATWAGLRPAPRGGSRTKKLNRRRAAKSKSKSKSMSMFKSAKRAFYKMNKRNKTSRKH